MEKFEIHYKSHVTIEAENFDEAVKKFHETHFMPDRVVNVIKINDLTFKEVFGYCETCELPVFIDDIFFSDNEDGIIEHSRCVDPKYL